MPRRKKNIPPEISESVVETPESTVETPERAETAATASTDTPASAETAATASTEAPDSTETAATPPPEAPENTVETPERAAAATPTKTFIPLTRILLDGIVRKNPLLVAGLGLAPALLLADAAAALAVGVCTTLALLVTSLLASLCGRYLPEKFRPALFTLVAAGLTVALEFGVGALLPDLLPRAALCIALIAVGGLTLSRAEYSTARPPLAALVDALANGAGYTLALTLIGALRELLGAGSIFGADVTFGVLPPMSALTAAAGGFILVGLLAGVMQGLRLARARRRTSRAAAKSNDKEVSA